ncbi:glycosyltransferase family 4 protein [Bradyrhizobium sp. JYMT SZCCT0180]|uniref:glycosyltransferase family 4 protein n=1 Tax=Bradyrhizobium sp. JYMT SZCCT0180 TaxID=2807666 RepID=UPI001BA57DEE|nr:glycosyltransferase family 4 protein [Bradyrhizobium sp. JYMT SZCCT0180]MBR1213947.1 glycosyltransferase family 4 protein [Bradyrhizobium sp. JYMT SZCCT0180]
MNTLMPLSRKKNQGICAETKGADSSGAHKRSNGLAQGGSVQVDTSRLVKSTDQDVLRVMVATPLGQYGRGGIDRLTDLIVETINRREDLGVEVRRLVTRGEKRWWPVVFARALIEVGVATRRRDVDLLHIQLAWGGSLYRKLMIAALARYFRVPYVVHLHGGRFDWAKAGRHLARRIEQFFIDSAAIIVLGQCWASHILDRLPSVKDKITILPNTTTLPNGARRDRADGERIQISFLGHVQPAKGVPQLIEALGKISARADWSATIAGNGELDQSRSHAQRLAIADRVDIPGWLGPDETAALLRRTDILVLPSFVENLPMVVIEGFAYGLAVVATPVGAVPEVIDHERNGLLVPVGDVEALAGALHRLLEDRGLRRSLGEAARRDYAERFEISTYITRLVSTWRKAARP